MDNKDKLISVVNYTFTDIETGEVLKSGTMFDDSIYQECPECHMKTLEVMAHCAICINCGYSLCGI